MSAISLKSITGITSITTPTGVDNQLTLHTNDTTQRVKVTQSGIEVVGVATFQDLDVDGHTNLDNVSVAGVSTFSGDITIADKIIHTGDTDTAIRFPAADTIRFEVGNQQAVHILPASAGSGGARMGLGTNNPTGMLHIYGSNPPVRIQNSNDSANLQFGMWDTANIMFQASHRTFKFATETSHPIVFHTGGLNNERLRITSGGNVGINSITPRGKLDIGFAGAPSFITFGADADNPKVEFFRSTGGSPSHYATEIQQILGDLVLSTAATANLGSHSYEEKLRITSAGDVSISGDGTVHGVSKLTILPANRTTAFSASDGDTWHDVVLKQTGSATNNAVGIAFETSTSGYHKNAGTGIAAVKNGTNSDYGSDLVFITRPQSAVAEERLRIDSSGRTLIGTSTQNNSARLQVSTSNQVVATFEGTGSSDPQIYLGDNMASPTDNCIILGYDKADNRGYLTVGGDGDSVFTVTNGGNIGINQSSPQANAKLHVEGNVGTSGYFYTTTTSTPQTDFTSSQASNKAGLLLHRSSETNLDYGGLEFHGHPSSITAYRKGGIYYQTTGSGFGRGDIVFANDNAGDSANVSPTDKKFVIKNDGGLRAFTASNGVSSFSNADHGNVDFSHRDGRLLHSNGAGWDGNGHGDGADPILVLAVENRAGNSDIGDAMGLVLHSESQDDNDYAPLLAWSCRSNSGSYNTTIAAIVAQKKAQAVDHNWSSGDLHFFTNKPSGTQSGYMNNVADMTITQHGYVTMPRQPVFSATTSVTRSAGNIVFDVTSCNVGGHYSTSNGRFTAPVAGVYYFSFYGMSPHNNTSNQRVLIKVNGTNFSGGQYAGGVGYSGYTNGGYTHLTLSTALPLAVNDYVQIDWQYANLHDGHCKFSGFLVG